MEGKADIREAALARRDAIPLPDRERKSALVCERLLAELGPVTGKAVAVYAAMGSEVSLGPFIHEAYAQGARVCFPCMTRAQEPFGGVPPQGREEGETLQAYAGPGSVPPQDVAEGASSHGRKARKGVPQEMAFREVPQEHHEAGGVPFIEGPLRPHPADSPALDGFSLVSPSGIDVVVVPMVAFDLHLNRLGYGGGNYDRFLPTLRPDAIVVGVAFMEQQVPHVPVEGHDRPLPSIISA